MYHDSFIPIPFYAWQPYQMCWSGLLESSRERFEICPSMVLAHVLLSVRTRICRADHMVMSIHSSLLVRGALLDGKESLVSPVKVTLVRTHAFPNRDSSLRLALYSRCKFAHC